MAAMAQTLETAPAKATRREWIGLAVIALPCLLYAMDLTVLTLAIPSLAADLNPTSTELLWIVDIYGFLVAGFLITMGTLGDRIGRRRLLLVGAAAFGAASVLAAFAQTPEMLIASRALLGIAGATLAPSTLSLIRNMFHDSHQRTVAIGIWVTSFSTGAAIGPLVGGVLLESFHWGSVFLLAVPVMAVLLAVGPKLLPEYKDPNPGRLDLASAALSLTAVLAVIFGIKELAKDGLEPLGISALVAGLAIGAAFIDRQRRLAEPMIDLGLFRRRAFSLSLSANTLAFAVVFGLEVFVAQYFQLVLGYSPLEAGLWSLPGALAFVVGSQLTPPLAARIRPPVLMLGGIVVAIAGVAMLTQVSAATGPGWWSPGSSSSRSAWRRSSPWPPTWPWARRRPSARARRPGSRRRARSWVAPSASRSSARSGPRSTAATRRRASPTAPRPRPATRSAARSRPPPGCRRRSRPTCSSPRARRSPRASRSRRPLAAC